MKNLMKTLSILMLLALVGLDACKKDDPKPAVTCDGTLGAAMNNAQFTGATFNNTLLKSSGTKRMDIRATDSKGRQLIITFTDLSSGTTGNGISTDAYVAFDDVSTGTENTFFFTIIENSADMITSGSLDITSCNADTKKVSGTFSFSDGDYVVTAGTFTNLCYTIVQ
jgi:hypothetical protein